MKTSHSRPTAAAIMSGAALAASAVAQTPPAATLLPGDDVPPPLARMVTPMTPPAPGAAPVARPAPPPLPAGPSFAVALEAARAAIDFCRTKGTLAGVAVSDSLGNLVVGLNGEGAQPGRIYMAARKNLAAIAFGRPSFAAQAPLHAGDEAALALVKPNMIFWGGAAPIIVEGGTSGAFGVSGGSLQRDEECAAAGVAAIKGRR